MRISIFIEPHERIEALNAYASRLSATQVSDIEAAPESALIQLSIDGDECAVRIIEEG